MPLLMCESDLLALMRAIGADIASDAEHELYKWTVSHRPRSKLWSSTTPAISVG